MPELPEVQTIVDDLAAQGLTGCRIVSAHVRWARTIAEPGARAFCRQVAGRRIECLRRRAKMIVIELDERWYLLVHLRMTGQFHLGDDARSDPHDRLTLVLSDGRSLHYHDTRKFGRWWLTKDPGRILDRFGPEPLDPAFTAQDFALRLRARHRMLKPLLLDQTFLAGLGNIYVDEALFEARLHPCTGADSLSTADAGRLHRAIRRVLRRGLSNMGTTLGTGETNFYSVGRRPGRNRDGLRVFRRTGQPCPVCATTVERIVVGQRSTHVCPACQLAP